MRGALGPVLGLVDIIGRLDALTISTTSSADFLRDFEEGAVGDCSRGLHSVMDDSWHNSNPLPKLTL